MEPIDWGVPYLAGIFWLAIVLAVAWSMVWKAIALWYAGRNGQLGWFIVLFLVNTLGILEIIYIFAFRRVVPRPRKVGKTIAPEKRQ